jgi:hypothetical protein
MTGARMGLVTRKEEEERGKKKKSKKRKRVFGSKSERWRRGEGEERELRDWLPHCLVIPFERFLQRMHASRFCEISNSIELTDPRVTGQGSFCVCRVVSFRVVVEHIGSISISIIDVTDFSACRKEFTC